MPKWNAKVLFLGLVVALGGYTFWDFHKEGQKVATDEQASVLVPFKMDQIDSVQIKNKELRISLARSVDGWKITAPLEDWADNSAVEDFLSQIVLQKSFSTLPPEATNLALYGLSSPAGEIVIHQQNNEALTFEVGGKKSFEGHTYLKKKDSPEIYVAPGEWADWVQRRPFDFRDKRLLRKKTGAIDVIEIKNRNGDLKLILKDNKWRSPQKPEWVFDPNLIHEVLVQISSAQATEVVAEKTISEAEKQKYGLNQPSVTIHFGLGEDQWTARLAEDAKKQIYALVSAPVFILKLNPAFYESMQKLKLSRLKDQRELFKFDASLAKKITLQTALKKQNLVKGERWTLSDASAGATVDSEKVDELLKALGQMRIADFAESGQALQGGTRLEIQDADGKSSFTLQWGPAQNRKLNGPAQSVALAKSSQSADLFYLEQSEIDKLPLRDIMKTKNDKN